MEANNSKKHVVTHLLLILGSIVMLFPFLWMILSSFKTVGEQMSIPMKILPGSFGYLENYKQALEAVPFLRLYLNTILMILGRVICAVIFSSMAGYGFARMEFPFKRLLFTLVLMQMMVPGQIFIVVYDVIEDQAVKYGICTDIPGTGQRVWHVPSAPAVYGAAEGAGGGCRD